jgi:hypothetical protein
VGFASRQCAFSNSTIGKAIFNQKENVSLGAIISVA